MVTRESLVIMRRWFWMGGTALAVVAAAAGVWATRAPEVPVVVLQTAPLVRTLQFSARVATLSRVQVGSTLIGRVAKVLVDQGAQVQKGDALVQLETEELQAALAQARAAERQAQARLSGLRSTGRAAANAQLMQAQASVRAAEAEMTRSEELVAQGFLSQARLDEARRAVEVARGQQAAAQAQTRANDDSGTEVAQAQAQLAQALAASAAAQVRLAQATIRAPSSAQVLARNVEPGQIVQPGAALLSLALAGPTQLAAQVDERFLDQLRTGQQAAVVADAFATQPFTAKVLSIAPAVDPQRGAIEVKLALTQQVPDFLREDMTLSVEVETGRRDRALVLPLSALRSTPNSATATAWVAQDGTAQARLVRLGLRTLDAAEVLEGVREGEAVLLGGAVAQGARVRTKAVVWKPGAVTAVGAAPDGAAAMTNAMAR